MKDRTVILLSFFGLATLLGTIFLYNTGFHQIALSVYVGGLYVIRSCCYRASREPWLAFVIPNS